MIYPSADTIEDKVKSRYSLVVLAAKRAKQIKEGAPILIDTASTNPLTIALEEIAAGKVTVLEAEGELVPQETKPSRRAMMTPSQNVHPTTPQVGSNEIHAEEPGEDDAAAA